MATTAELQAELADLETRRRTTAGIDSTTFADQSTRFDHESLDRRIAAIRQELELQSGRTRTRYGAFTKGV